MNLKRFSSNATAKTISVLCAIILWFHVATDQSYSYKITVPIQYIAPSSGMILASTPPTNAQVYVTGTGKSLFAYMFRSLLNPRESYVSVPLTGYQKGTHRIDLSPEEVYLAGEHSITVETILSDTSFPVTIDRKVARSIPVDTDSLPPFTVASDVVLLGKPQPDPSFVVIEGPEDSVRFIDSVRVSRLLDTTLSPADSIVHAVLDSLGPFVTLNEYEVLLRFPLEPLLTRRFPGVPVVYRGFPASFNGGLHPDTLSVVIQGPESVVAATGLDDIEVAVTYRLYSDLVARGDSVFAPDLSHPSDLTRVTTLPETLHLADIRQQQ